MKVSTSCLPYTHISAAPIIKHTLFFAQIKFSYTLIASQLITDLIFLFPNVFEAFLLLELAMNCQCSHLIAVYTQLHFVFGRDGGGAQNLWDPVVRVFVAELSRLYCPGPGPSSGLGTLFSPMAQFGPSLGQLQNLSTVVSSEVNSRSGLWSLRLDILSKAGALVLSLVADRERSAS